MKLHKDKALKAIPFDLEEGSKTEFSELLHEVYELISSGCPQLDDTLDRVEIDEPTARKISAWMRFTNNPEGVAEIASRVLKINVKLGTHNLVFITQS